MPQIADENPGGSFVAAEHAKGDGARLHRPGGTRGGYGLRLTDASRVETGPVKAFRQGRPVCQDQSTRPWVAFLRSMVFNGHVN